MIFPSIFTLSKIKSLQIGRIINQDLISILLIKLVVVHNVAVIYEELVGVLYYLGRKVVLGSHYPLIFSQIGLVSVIACPL